MHRIFRYIGLVTVISLLGIAALSCGRDRMLNESLDRVESMLATSPDSALILINDLNSADISHEEDKARYALLKSMALDKNYVDTTSFEILQPAIEYYLRKGTADEKLRTYYYQGRIYQNSGKDEEAIESFMKASDLCNEINDSITLGNDFLALATINYRQLKIDRFIHYSLLAANIYRNTGKASHAVNAYAKAWSGLILQRDKERSDSVKAVLNQIIADYPEYESTVFYSRLQYYNEYGTIEDISNYLKTVELATLSSGEKMDVALAFSNIGDNKTALYFLSKIGTLNNSFDSIRFSAVKTLILERLSDYQDALEEYKRYISLSEAQQYRLISDEAVFTETRHKLELDHIESVRKRDRIIFITLLAVAFVVICGIWLCYRYKLLRNKNKLSERKAAFLELKQLSEQQERERIELELANVRLEKRQIEEERDRLTELYNKNTKIAPQIKEIIRVRLEILNGLLVEKITNTKSHSKEYNDFLDTISRNKLEFMNSTRHAFAVSHPKFIKYLENCGLTTEEINLLCLYGLGLNGRQVGEFVQSKRHYIEISAIRKKLGLNEHQTNISIYIKQLLKAESSGENEE